MSTYSERLGEAMKAAGVTITQLANGIGISYQAIKKVNDGGSKAFDASNNAKAANFLGVNSDWLALGVGEMLTDAGNVTTAPTIKGTVPILSSVQAGAFRDHLEAHQDDMEYIQTSTPVNTNTFALRVKGPSMEPDFVEGMILIVEPDFDPQPNDYVIAKNGGDETTFKQLVKDGGDWYLKPLNPRFPIKLLGNSTIIGVVRSVERKFR